VNPKCDGDCQFEAAADQLNTVCKMSVTADICRLTAVGFISRNEGMFKDFVLKEVCQLHSKSSTHPPDCDDCHEQQESSWTSYVQQMETHGCFGDHLTLLAMSYAFHIQWLVVSSSESASASCIVSGMSAQVYDPSIPLLILGHDVENVHYVSLHKPDNLNAISSHVRGMENYVLPAEKSPQTMPSPEGHAAHALRAASSKREHDGCTKAKDADYYDIGLLTNRRELSDFTRRSVLSGCDRRPTDYQFPQRQGRRYNPTWEQQFKWLRYSASLDAAFCAPCVVFAVSNKNSELIDMPFQDWKNAVGTKRGTLNTHSLSDIHKQSLVAADNFLKVANAEVKPITSFLSQAYCDKVARNRTIIKSLIEVVLVCARRGFPLRGHQWNKSEHTEDGNFEYLVQWASQTNDVLRRHLDSAPGNAKYLSPDTQNEFIACIKHEIREQIVERCNRSTFFSIMADETTDCGGIEQLSICVRYVFEVERGLFEICEDFIGFAKLKVTDAETIADKLLSKLSKWGVNMAKLRGKGFDGASTMSGHISGVQARITEILPHAKYFTHCASHCLNLVVVQCCGIQIIRTFMDSFHKLSFFIRASAKRKAIQSDIFAHDNGGRGSHFPDYDDDDAESVNEALHVGYAFKYYLHSARHAGWLALMH
jgi:hypothetical protein